MGNVLDGKFLSGYLYSMSKSQAHVSMNNTHIQCFCFVFVCVSEGRHGINNGLRSNKLSVERLWAVDHWDQH